MELRFGVIFFKEGIIIINTKSKIYISIITILGIIVTIYSFYYVNYSQIVPIIIFGIAAAITGSLPVYIAREITVSVAYAIDLASIFIFGPYEAIIIGLIENIFEVVKKDEGGYYSILNRPYYKTLFNISQLSLCIGISGFAYKYFGGIPGEPINLKNILPIIIASIAYYLINAGLVTTLLSIMLNKSILSIWEMDFKWALINFLFMAFIGVAIASSFIKYGYIALIIFFIPLLMVRYIFKLYMDLKLSYYDTIDALTKALEAKDQYTLGHSKSVEKISALLCKEARFSETHTEMVRIAALLHDIGKIGIVEEILNKPGKLSDEEFDKIRNHASYGYEILKDIPFLKNVKYWVRYHHEWYNGSGYPDGISGNKIPLEAEILSIADVFDALVSDRPYRNAYTRDEAYKIIVESEGTQFSHRIINLFKKAYKRNKEDFKHDF